MHRHVADLNVSLMMKLVAFFRSLLASPSGEVQVVARLAARDMRSNMGKNLALIREAIKRPNSCWNFCNLQLSTKT